MELHQLSKYDLIKMLEEKIELEKNYQSMLNHSTEAVFCYQYDPPIDVTLPLEQQILRLYDGVLFQANDITAQSYGYSRSEDVLEKGLLELFKANKGDLDKFFQSFIENGYAINDAETKEQQEDGSYRYFLNTGSGTIKDNRLHEVWGTYRDITEIKKTEEELKKSEEDKNEIDELYRAITQISFEAVIISVDGKLVYASDYFAEMYGYDSIEEMKELTPFDLCTPESAKIVVEKLKTNDENPYEFEGLKKDGSTFYLESVSQKTTFKGTTARLTVMRDVTPRKLLINNLEETKEKYLTMFENAPEAILIFDEEKGVYVDANPRALKLFKISRENLQTITPLMLADPIQEGGVPAEDLILSEMKETVERVIEWSCRDLEGRTFPAEIRIIRLPPFTKKLERISIIDLTDKKASERELQTIREGLLQASKMDAIGRLAGGIAHDFNNMLTGILGYSSFLKDEMAEADPLKSAVLEIEKAGKRSASLVRQLLTFSRKQVVGSKIINLNEVLTDTMQVLIRLLGENIRLIEEFDNSLWNINMDPNQFTQIMMNLAVNASDAMPNGGTLRIITKNTYFDSDHIVDGDETSRECVSLTVSDTGNGIDADTLQHVFEPFFTTKNQGTGLGLSTVYGIVKQNNGTIEVESQLGMETSFHIKLPRSPEKISSNLERSSNRLINSQREGNILLIEDEETVSKFITYILSSCGFQVSSYNNPVNALEMITEYPEAFDLVISDIVLPEMSGLEVYESIITINEDTKILFISGYVDRPIHKKITDLGYRILEKPFTRAKLLQTIDEILL